MSSSKDEQRIWVELSGDIIVARLRGSVTEKDVADAQAQVLLLLRETQRTRVLYDTLEMEPPSIDLVFAQQVNSERLHSEGVRISILVPTTRLAFLARIAFGQGNYRVFYNDLAEAIAWLAGTET